MSCVTQKTLKKDKIHTCIKIYIKLQIAFCLEFCRDISNHRKCVRHKIFIAIFTDKFHLSPKLKNIIYKLKTE